MRTAVPTTSNCRSSTRRSARWRGRRTSPSSTAIPPPASWASPNAARTRPSSSMRTWTSTPRWWPRRPTCSGKPGSAGPTGSPSAPSIYTGIVETTEHGGHLLLDHLRQILGGPLVWAPGVQCGIVVSLRGGDFVIDSGQDLSIGYLSHDARDGASLYRGELQLPGTRTRRGRCLAARGLNGLTPPSRTCPVRGAGERARGTWRSCRPRRVGAAARALGLVPLCSVLLLASAIPPAQAGPGALHPLVGAYYYLWNPENFSGGTLRGAPDPAATAPGGAGRLEQPRHRGPRHRHRPARRNRLFRGRLVALRPRLLRSELPAGRLRHEGLPCRAGSRPHQVRHVL